MLIFNGVLEWAKMVAKAIKEVVRHAIAHDRAGISMLSHYDLEGFLQDFAGARSGGDLHEALGRVTKALGFSHFALGHHVDLAAPPDGTISLTTYNEEWIAHGLERKHFAQDPIHLASTKTINGFLWHNVGDIIRLTPRHKQILTEAVAFGLGAGFTVPAHVPGEYQGSCSYAARSLDDLKQNALRVGQLCGTFAFEAARRIIRRQMNLAEADVPNLTPRQVEALILVGRGKTDGEIGEILGVSRATAHEHVEGVRQAYGNAQRPYLIVRALFDGQVAFTDLLRR